MVSRDLQMKQSVTIVTIKVINNGMWIT